MDTTVNHVFRAVKEITGFTGTIRSATIGSYGIKGSVEIFTDTESAEKYRNSVTCAPCKVSNDGTFSLEHYSFDDIHLTLFSK